MKGIVRKFFIAAACTLVFVSIGAGQDNGVSAYGQGPGETVLALGGTTDFGEALIGIRQVMGPDPEAAPPWLVYINGAAGLSARDKQWVMGAMQSGSAIVLDNTGQHSPEGAESVSVDVLGVGFLSPVVVAYRKDGKMRFTPMDYPGISGASDDRADVSENITGMLGRAETVLDDYRISKSQPLAMAAPSAATWAAAGTPYRPEYSFTVDFSYNNKACTMKKALDGYDFGSELWDPCAGNASINLVFSVDLIRSVPGYTAAGQTEDNKYVRISLDNDNGAGAGFFLKQDLIQKHTWFQSWAHRDEWFGPFADNYEIQVYPSTNTGSVTLLKHLPHNVNPETEYRQITGFNVGMGIKGTAEVGGEGPKVGGEVSAEFGYNSSRWVSFKTHEYTVVNATNNLTGIWKWDRKYNDKHCDWLTARDFGTACYFSRPLWGQDWVAKQSAFSGISHSNYTPGMSITYKAPASKTGTTRFDMEATVTAMGLGGKIIPDVLFWLGKFVDTTTSGFGMVKSITVDWEHPVFEPEAHVRLHSLGHNNACLEPFGDSSGSYVGWNSCWDVNWQLWGLDAGNRYKSRIAPNRCLAVESNLKVSVRACDNSQNQKWRWDGDNLLSYYVDGSGNSNYALFRDSYNNAVVKPVSADSDFRWKPYLQKPFSN